jgi:hypothetical protein
VKREEERREELFGGNATAAACCRSALRPFRLEETVSGPRAAGADAFSSGLVIEGKVFACGRNWGGGRRPWFERLLAGGRVEEGWEREG